MASSNLLPVVLVEKLDLSKIDGTFKCVLKDTKSNVESESMTLMEEGSGVTENQQIEKQVFKLIRHLQSNKDGHRFSKSDSTNWKRLFPGYASNRGVLSYPVVGIVLIILVLWSLQSFVHGPPGAIPETKKQDCTSCDNTIEVIINTGDLANL